MNPTPLFVEAKKTFLKVPASATETGEIVLNRLVDCYGNQLTMANFGSIGYLTFDPGGDQEEIISFTDFTVNPDGSTSIDTGIVRGLAAVSPYATGGTAYDQAAGTLVVVSNSPQLLQLIINYINGVVASGAANASTTVKGILQVATQAQINAGTRTGSTGAILTIAPDDLLASVYGLQLPTAGQKQALSGNVGTPSSSNTYITLQGLKAFQLDQQQATQNGSFAVGQSVATNNHILLAQKFIPGVTSIGEVRLWKAADTGSFTGTVKISLQADTTGSPSGVDLASYTITNAVWLKLTAAAEFAVTFTSQYESLTPGSPYWIVVTPSTSDSSNHPNLGINTAGGYASGALKYKDADGWEAVTTTILYFKEYSSNLSKLAQTDATSGLVLQKILPYALALLDVNAQTISATTTETTVASVLLPGGFFTLNSGIRVKGSGTVSASSTTAITVAIKVKINGTVIATMTSASASDNNDSVTNYGLLFDAVILNSNSLSTQKVLASILSVPQAFNQSTTTNHFTPSTISTQVTPTNSADTSEPVLLEVTFTNSSSTSTQSTYAGLTVEKIG